MTVTRSWERIRQVFHAALEQPAQARTDFLSRACGSDDEMRREVQSLLEAHAGAGAFLDNPVVRLDAARVALGAPALRTGDIVGDFEVVGVLGEGGMGEVYRGRDRRLDRRPPKGRPSGGAAG